MNKITNFLDRASQAYYSGAPFISDEQFDKLSESAGYNNVGAKQNINAEKHLYQMYSLQKYYEDEGARPLEGVTDVAVSIKLDGAAISLLYIDGTLVRALTRGDGVEGQLITDKMLNTNIVPHSIPHAGVLQVTGEIVAPVNIENSRNYAAGSLNLKDLEEFKTRALSFFAYNAQPAITETFDGDLQKLKRYGFSVINDPNLDKIFPCDGIVYRVNNNKQFYELGFTSKHPRGAYAKKIRQPHTETVLREVEWNVAKTGRVTPVAIFDPVNIDGKVINRATLNNPGFIEMLDLRIGDTIAVRLAGMIIPEVTHKVE
jgi:DNA ligase (NAD+)